MGRGRSPHESALFWIAVAGGVLVVGGVFVPVGVALKLPKQSVWEQPWFDVGIAGLIVGVLILAWSVRLYLVRNPSTPKPKPETINVRLQLLIRDQRGKELVADAAAHGKEVAEANARSWAESMTRFLGLHMHGGVEPFETAGEGSASQRMAARLAVVAKLIATLSDEERQRARAQERAGELREDRQLRVEPDSVQPRDAERQE